MSEYVAIIFVVIVAMMCGYAIGLIHKGVHIHMHKEEKKQEGYNESLVNMLPTEVKQYYSETQGNNNWK
jgi:hypothetical protein